MGHTVKFAQGPIQDFQQDHSSDPYSDAWLRNKLPNDGRISLERGSRQLLIDLDVKFDDFKNGQLPQLEFENKIKRLKQAARIKITEYVYWPSKKSRNTHIIVYLKEPISDETATLYQMFLGSDPFREVMAYSRLQNNIFPAILFFDDPDFIIDEQIVVRLD